MNHSLSPTAAATPRAQNQLAAISVGIANSMLGRLVSLRVGAKAAAHGVVAGILLESGAPKLVVNGSCYELGQVLTVTPVALN
jgi:hypothetical protein